MTATYHLQGRKLLVATHNPGKAREIADLLAPLGAQIVSAADLGLAEPEETETTFIGNALLKARAAASAANLPALADDSGLSVDALGGEPGIYSARWAGPQRDFDAAMRKVQERLGDAEDRSAKFVCALALVDPEAGEVCVQGEVRGTLVWPPRGDQGFGYDPMFEPLGWDRTFGEIDPAAKHAISHRADAFAKLLETLAG